MVSELASCNQLEISVDEVLSETAIVDTSFEPAIGHAPDLSTRSGSEIAPEVTSRSTSSPREVVLVVDPAPDTDAPGEPDEAEKVTAVTRESSAQLSNDKSRRVLLWVTVDRVRQGGRPALLVKLSPSPSTNPDVVGFTVEEHSHSYRLIAGPCRLTRSGYRLVRRADGLRLAIGWWR
jgi:hypothetical protein